MDMGSVLAPRARGPTPAPGTTGSRFPASTHGPGTSITSTNLTAKNNHLGLLKWKSPLCISASPIIRVTFNPITLPISLHVNFNNLSQ